jgi:hypothetical protein
MMVDEPLSERAAQAIERTEVRLAKLASSARMRSSSVAEAASSAVRNLPVWAMLAPASSFSRASSGSFQLASTFARKGFSAATWLSISVETVLATS